MEFQRTDPGNLYVIERQSLAEQVYRYIKRLILSGQIRGGERIPEERVALRFGVSRTPIREALKRLEQYGLVYIKPRSFAEVVYLDPSEAEHVSIVRAQLEALSVGLLTASGREEDFDSLENLATQCDCLIARGDIAGTFEIDSRLHLEIARRTGNRHLYELFEQIDAKVQLLRLTLALPLDKLAGYVNQHLSIVCEMRKGSRESAEERMRLHILKQLNDYRPNEPVEASICENIEGN